MTDSKLNLTCPNLKQQDQTLSPTPLLKWPRIVNIVGHLFGEAPVSRLLSCDSGLRNKAHRAMSGWLCKDYWFQSSQPEKLGKVAFSAEGKWINDLGSAAMRISGVLL